MQKSEALKIAIEEFKKVSFETIPERCGGEPVDNRINPALPAPQRNFEARQGWVKIKYLAKWYLVSPASAEVTCLRGESEVSEREKVIILHYLTRGNGTPLSGKLIDFREVPGGNMYYSVFEARVYQPFLAFFGRNLLLFAKVSAALEGERIDLGDSAFKFTVLPKIPINFILHKGDEEFPPACKVLFDSSIRDYLPTEDIAIVCEDTVKQLQLQIRN